MNVPLRWHWGHTYRVLRPLYLSNWYLYVLLILIYILLCVCSFVHLHRENEQMNMNKPRHIGTTLRSEKSKVKTEKCGVCDACLIDRNTRNDRSASLDRSDSKREPYPSRASNPIAPIIPIAPTLLIKSRAKHTLPFTFHISHFTSPISLLPFYFTTK